MIKKTAIFQLLQVAKRIGSQFLSGVTPYFERRNLEMPVKYSVFR